MLRPRLTPRAVLFFLAVAFGAAALTVRLTSERLPELTSERLEVASKRWRDAHVGAYSLGLEMQGSELERGAYDVEVGKDGSVRASRNRIPVTGEARSYAVEGLLATLAEEVRNLSDPQRTFGAPPGYRAYLYARFDERGIPQRYRRVVGGTNRWSEWTVARFEAR